jgi:hypothetical protein
MNGLVEYVFRHLKTEFRGGEGKKWIGCRDRHYYNDERRK